MDDNDPQDNNQETDTVVKKVFDQLKTHYKHSDIILIEEDVNQYLMVKDPEENSKDICICPVNGEEVLTFEKLKSCVESSETENVVMAIQDVDSSTVFYEANIGLKLPINTSVSLNRADE